MNVNILDIPRVYTGIAEWLACMVFCLRLEPRLPLRWRIPVSLTGLAVQCLFLVVTDDIPIFFWIPCMITAALLMMGLILALCDLDLASGAYACVHAFVLAEFTASLEWQMHCFLWPENHPAWWQRWGLLVLIYGGVFTVMTLLLMRSSPRRTRLMITGHELLITAMMGVCIFAISNLSFYFKDTPPLSAASMPVRFIISAPLWICAVWRSCSRTTFSGTAPWPGRS